MLLARKPKRKFWIIAGARPHVTHWTAAKVGGLLFAILIATASCSHRPDPLPTLPHLMLWAWERPERLRFIDPHTTGVAFLARTISWRDGHVNVRRRYQPLELPPETAVMAVTRLQSDSPPLPDLDAIANAALETATLPRVQAIEIDFDARRSEREWYAALLRRVRQRLAPSMPLTITALASWCLSDPWISGLPVNDAVPMFFRMGVGEPQHVRDVSLSMCRSSLGLSMDEIPLAAPLGRRLFVFNPRPWTPDAYRDAVELARRWR